MVLHVHKQGCYFSLIHAVLYLRDEIRGTGVCLTVDRSYVQLYMKLSNAEQHSIHVHVCLGQLVVVSYMYIHVGEGSVLGKFSPVFLVLAFLCWGCGFVG